MILINHNISCLLFTSIGNSRPNQLLLHLKLSEKSPRKMAIAEVFLVMLQFFSLERNETKKLLRNGTPP